MLRDESIEQIWDGRLYGANDMVKCDTGGCRGCSRCCHDVGDTLLLDPLDVYRLHKAAGLSFSRLLEGFARLREADGLILPCLQIRENGSGCAFLDDQGRCSVHEARPTFCRLFPLGRYYYEGDRFAYILQIHECDRPKTKVKVKKWIDIPDLPKNEDYAGKWHGLLHRARQLAMQDPDLEIRKQICMILLEEFYQRAYDLSEDFYAQFEDRVPIALHRMGLA